MSTKIRARAVGGSCTYPTVGVAAVEAIPLVRPNELLLQCLPLHLSGLASIDGIVHTERTMTEKVKPDFTMIGLSSGVPTLDDIIALAKHLTGKDLSPECIAELKAQMVRDGYPTDEASSLLASNPS